MPVQQIIVGMIFSVLFFVFLIELVRRKKMKEEYSFLWFIINFIFIAILFKYDILVYITQVFGMSLVSSALFFLGISFLLIYSIFITIKISSISRQSNYLAQEIALLKNRLDETEIAPEKET